jgi:molybdate transport system ATP-binding protein
LLIKVSNVSVTLGGLKVLDNISLVIRPSEVVCITGASGSGKTSLANAIAGTLFHSGTVDFEGYVNHVTVEYVPQQHEFKDLSNTSQFYYQQRYNASESDQSLKVSDLLSEDSKWTDPLQLRHVWDRPLIQLSNGENKRLQLARKLSANPQVLILDNPFVGLDINGRAVLESVLYSLVAQGLQLILISSAAELPAIVTHVALLDKGALLFYGSRQMYLQDSVSQREAPIAYDFSSIHALVKKPVGDFEFAVRLVNVNVRYDGKPVLQNISWEVRRGECWSLSGPNGAGKSTLLSLVTGDNPQAYSNEIYLFDRRRGTGESIWDIKRRIGFVSPELHLFFDQQSTCYEVIASGLFDTIGLFRVLHDEQKEIVQSWIHILKLNDYVDRPLRLMSRGQQRLALLGRALVKNPAMLVLDEPCQGLDADQTESFGRLISSFCESFGTTMIYVSHYRQELPSCINHSLELRRPGDFDNSDDVLMSGRDRK